MCLCDSRCGTGHQRCGHKAKLRGDAFAIGIKARRPRSGDDLDRGSSIQRLPDEGFSYLEIAQRLSLGR